MQSLQAAIESYSLTLGAARSRQSPASDESESTTSAFWTSAFPTSAYYRNVFYQGMHNFSWNESCQDFEACGMYIIMFLQLWGQFLAC